MSIKIHIVFFALIICLSTIGQTEKDYLKFKETLHKEINDTGQNENQASPTILHPAELPTWISNLPASSPNFIYSLGISDPGMERIKL
ncbi:MAG: hypothetical protein R2764_05580 [Bacteroidales bacterium]